MANVLSSLMVTLGADTAAFQQDMGKAGKTAKTEFEKITDGAKAMGAALAAAFAVDALKDGIMSAVDYADKMSDMSQRVGQSVESLTAMGYAAQFSGTSVETYSAGIEKLNSNMVSAVEGNDQAEKMFSKLGVSVKDANGQIRDSQSVFLDLADKVSAIQSPAEKTAVVMDLFGKSAGPELLQMLDQGKGGLTALTDEAARMGAVVSTDTANQAGQFNDTLDKMKIAGQGVFMQIAGQMLPVFNQMTATTAGSADNMNILETAAGALSVALKTVYTVGGSVFVALKAMGDGLGQLAASAVQFIQGNFKEAAEIFNDTSSVDKYATQLADVFEVWRDVDKAAGSAADSQKKAISVVGGDASAGSSAGRRKGKAAAAVGAGKKGSRADELLADEGIARDVTDIAYDAMQRNREFEETEAARVLAANDSAAQLEDLKNRQLAGERELQEAKRQEIALTKDFFLNGLDQMAQGHGKAAKAAQAVQKAQTLYQIGVNTYSAAMGAYNALAGIPIVGPALGVAAAAAAIAFGGQMMAGVNSGGKPSAPGAPSLPSPSGGSASVQPVSMQQPERTQQTILQIPANSLMTGRMIADLLDDALGDGKQLTNLRVQAV